MAEEKEKKLIENINAWINVSEAWRWAAMAWELSTVDDEPPFCVLSSVASAAMNAVDYAARNKDITTWAYSVWREGWRAAEKAALAVVAAAEKAERATGINGLVKAAEEAVWLARHHDHDAWEILHRLFNIAYCHCHPDRCDDP